MTAETVALTAAERDAARAETAALKQAIGALIDEVESAWSPVTMADRTVRIRDLRALLEPTPEGNGK